MFVLFQSALFLLLPASTIGKALARIQGSGLMLSYQLHVISTEQAQQMYSWLAALLVKLDRLLVLEQKMADSLWPARDTSVMMS